MASPDDGPWASAEDWAKHRDTIVELYQQRSLAEVMEIMERDYQFSATARMYKGRLKKWGVQKYVKYPRSDTLQTDQLLLGYSQDRPSALSSDSLAAVLRARSSALPSTAPRVLPSIPSIARSLGSPGRQGQVLECLQSLQRYVQGNCFSGRWEMSPGFVTSLESSDWLAQTTTVRLLIQGGQVQHGFRLLEDCFESYKTNLLRDSPLLTSETFMACFSLLSVSPELGISFLRYACELAGIVYGKSHVLYRLFSGYLSLDIDVFSSCADMFLECYLGLMRDNVQGWDQTHHDALLLTTGRFFLLGLMEPPEYSRLVTQSELAAPEDMPMLGYDVPPMMIEGRYPPAKIQQETLDLLPMQPARIEVRQQGGIPYVTFQSPRRAQKIALVHHARTDGPDAAHHNP